MVYAALRIFITQKQWLPDIQFSKNYRIAVLNHLLAVRLRPSGYGRQLDTKVELSQTRLSYRAGGEYRVRTGDLLRARQALSQLS